MRSNAWMFVLVCSCMLTDSFAAAEELSNEDERVLSSIGDAYLANRHAFSEFTCRFTVKAGRAKSLQAAIDRGATSDVVTAKGIWVVHGEQQRYEFETEPGYFERQVKKQHAEGRQELIMLFSDEKFVSDGKLQVFYNSVPNLATVGPLDSTSGPSFTPTNLAMGSFEQENPATAIQQAVSMGICKLGAPQPNEPDIISVEVREPALAKGGPNGLAVYKFDSKRGHFPVRIEFGLDGQQPERIIVTSMRSCSKNRWFPERAIMIDVSPKDPTNCDVREIILTKLDADAQPSLAELTIALPKGIAINDGVTPGSQFVAANATEINPSRITPLLKMTEAAAKRR